MSGKWRKTENQEDEAVANHAFERHLETLPTFQARADFQSELRTRLAATATSQLQSKTTGWQWPRLNLNGPRLALVGMALVVIAVMFSLTVLYVTRVSETPIANAYNNVYDPESQAYVSSNQAAESLGFSVNAPNYLPQSNNQYKVETSLAPVVYTDTVESNRPAEAPNRVLQVSLIPKNASQNQPEFEIYEVRVPFNLEVAGQPVPPNPAVLQALHFQAIKVQGQSGYLIQGAAWRLVFQAPARSQNQTPGANRPPRNGAVIPIKSPTTPGSTNTPAVKPIPFVFGRARFSPNPQRPRYYIEFVPGQRWGANAKTTLWQKNGVLFMLVSGQNIADNELQRIAESFQEVNQPNK